MINNNKTIATVVLAVVMTVTALALASPQSSWDGALLTDSGHDSSVATTAAILNMSDVWSAFDAVSDVMSFEWLIPSAFAAPTIVSINGEALDLERLRLYKYYRRDRNYPNSCCHSR